MSGRKKAPAVYEFYDETRNGVHLKIIATRMATINAITGINYCGAVAY